ncbi:MAG: hypothetical protein ABGW97_16085 [Christiangramia sp.]|uniref:hypothetical protein n=1 Tax=Christiangramia sp. TaxID=1931228 RepID=UPI0032420463
MNIGVVDSELNFNYRLFCKTVSNSATWGFDRLRLYYPKWHTRIQVRRPDGSVLDTQQFATDNGFEHNFSFDLSENVNNDEYSVYICGVAEGNTYMQAYAYPTGYSATYGRNAQVTYWNLNIISPEHTAGVHGSLFLENQPLTTIDGALNIKAKTVRLQNSQLDAETLADIIIGLDGTGITGGSLNYSGNLAAPAERALTAYNNLKDTKGWTLTGDVPADSAYEPETISYMNVLGIPEDDNASIYDNTTNNQLWGAVDVFVKNLKDAGIFSKCRRVFPKIGNTAAKQAVDLVDSNRSGTFGGSWMHDKTGAVANGTNSYFNTGYQFQGGLANNGMTGVANAVSAGSESYATLMSYYTSGGDDLCAQIYLVYGSVNKVGFRFPDDLNADVSATSVGVWSLNIEPGSTVAKTYRNGNAFGVDVNMNGKSLPVQYTIFEGASKWDTNVIKNYLNAKIGTTAYHDGLTAAQSAILFNAIDTLESSINRKLYT